MNRPPISVCIPAFNAARWIALTVESVLAQTRRDFELLILDDCSSDGTLALVERFDDPRIRLLTHDRNLGAEAAWNRLLAEARGDFVKLLCSDDLLYPRCLERQAALLESPAQSGIGLACGPRDVIDADGRVILRRRGLRRAGRLDGRETIQRMVTRGGNLLGEPLAVLFRRDLAHRVGGFDATEPYCIDVDMWCRMLASADLAVTPETVGAFRVAGSTWSVRLARQQAVQDRAFLARVRRNLVPELASWRLGLGQIRCTRDALLRQLLYSLVLS